MLTLQQNWGSQGVGCMVAGVEIRQARQEHVADVTALAHRRSYDSMTDPAEASRQGFLVSEYSEAEYSARINSAEHFYVALKGSEVVGFLMAYSSDRIGPDEWVNHQIKVELGSYLVIKQVCVAPEAARKGVASSLYHHVLEQSPDVPVIAAVVTRPLNEASTSFHRKLGFEELRDLTPPGDHPRKVWVRRRPRESMLQTQYSVAVDLYKHEDLVNWNKLTNFLYITAALAGGMGFALSQNSAQAPAMLKGLLCVIAAIGAVCGFAFSGMLLWGRRYLLARKSAVIAFEEHMTWFGAQAVVGRDVQSPGRGWLLRSPTGMIMIGLPLLVSVGWLVLLAVVLAT